MEISKVEKVLTDSLPNGFNWSVTERSFLGNKSLKICVNPANKTINNVAGQYPAAVSLRLGLNDLELAPQVYGGNGGRTFIVNTDDSLFAYESIKIPFRKPKPVEKNILAAIEKFCNRYVVLLEENKDRLPDTELYTDEARQYLGIE